MQSFLVALNSFLEDTCVLVVIAYLLTRGQILSLVFTEDERRPWRDRLRAGLLLGAVGATEYLFPNQRAPYVPQTLFVTFAAVACGFRVSAITAFVILVAALPTIAGHPPGEIIALTLSVAVSLGVGSLLFQSRRFASGSDAGLLPAFTAGLVAQTGAVEIGRAHV